MVSTSGAGGAATYTYDANGNRATRAKSSQTDTYSYDAENRLITLNKQVADPGQTTGTYQYTYDYRTRRVERNESGAGGNVTKVVFSGGLSAFEREGSTNTVEYIRGSDYGGGIGGILYTLRGGTPSYTHYNNRGDVIAKTDDSGSVTYEATYEAFGRRTQENGATSDRQKANTKDEDPTGLLNEGFRYRDLETGAFLTRDPLGFVDGPNMYAYVRQNPWTMFDPEGLEKTAAGAKVDRDGHHVSPVETWDKNQLSKEVQDNLNKVRIKPENGEDVAHRWSKAHSSYNDRADAITSQMVADAKKAGRDPSRLSGKEAKEFADKLVKELYDDPYLNKFNEMVKEGKGTTVLLNGMREAALAEGILKDTGAMSAVRKASRWVAAKGGAVVKRVPGALKLVGAVAAVGEFTSDAQAKGVADATRTQYYRFGSLTGETPEESKASSWKASTWFYKAMGAIPEDEQ